VQDRLPFVKQEAKRIMYKYRWRVAGSFISEGPFSISFNYRNSDPDWAAAQSGFLIQELRHALNDSIVKVCYLSPWFSVCMAVCVHVGFDCRYCL
jgi:hypothetical protein